MTKVLRHPREVERAKDERPTSSDWQLTIASLFNQKRGAYAAFSTSRGTGDACFSFPIDRCVGLKLSDEWNRAHCVFSENINGGTY